MLYKLCEAFKGKFKGKTAGQQGNLQIQYSKAEKAPSRVTGQEKEYIAIHLGHVWKDNQHDIANAVNACGIPRAIMDCYVDPSDHVVFRVNPAMASELPNHLYKLEAALKSLGRYSDASIEKLCENLMDAIDSVATESDSEVANKNISKNWKEMLERLKDPEVRKRLLLYQMVGNYSTAYGFGHILSPNNVNEILSQKPNAAFVAERSTWRKIFHREVMPGAQRILVVQPIHGNGPSKQDLDAAARKKGLVTIP